MSFLTSLCIAELLAKVSSSLLFSPSLCACSVFPVWDPVLGAPHLQEPYLDFPSVLPVSGDISKKQKNLVNRQPSSGNQKVLAKALSTPCQVPYYGHIVTTCIPLGL